MGFFTRLEQRARRADSLLCIGLDPHPNDLSAYTAEAACSFCLRLIEACADSAAAFKPNAAFFEALGAAGMAALGEVIAAVPEGIPVILDAKRGDIASTAEAYAHAAYQVWGAQAITINPYLGKDSLDPFLQDAQHGVFLLCKTSNPGAADLQDLPIAATGGLALYEHVASLAQAWNEHDNLGLVVGATHPDALRSARSLAPDLWILAPGVGAQGGDLQAALQAGLRTDGYGMLIPVSRAISRAPDARMAAEQLRQLINQERQKIRPAENQPFKPSQARLADGLLAATCVQFGQFTLKSGLQSPVYIDLRRLVSYPDLLWQAAEQYAVLLRRLAFDRLAGLPYAALPIATAVSLLSHWPLIYPRKETKAYGTKVEVEGVYLPGERVVVIDDLTTTGSSKFEAIDKLVDAGLTVEDVVVLIDRQSGAAEALAAAGYNLHAVFTLTELVEYWHSTGSLSLEQVERVRIFIRSTTSR